MTANTWFDENALPRLERMVGVKVLGEVLDLYFEHAPKRIEAVRDGELAHLATADDQADFTPDIEKDR